MIHHYDTRWATYQSDGTTRRMTKAEKATHLAPLPRYWMPEAEVMARLQGRWDRSWLLGWRDVCRSTDERTMIATLLPIVGVGHKILLALPTQGRREDLQASWSSFVFDYVARQKLGGTSMSYFVVEQLPIPLPDARLPGTDAQWVGMRVDRLNGWVADAEERSSLRAELDAYAFHLYGLDRQEVDYVMDTFPIVRRKDEASFGEYRTKRMVIAAYDALAEQR